ncbi:hypothetical protein ACTACK_07175 [Pseudomonas syringae]|uniref:hypothetical protein n=1 Tax=Pseudomonas syringae TaxID=317 RepID=UPI003F751430
MLIKRFQIFTPIAIFIAISTTFWIVQFRLFDVIGWNYNACHALFGFAFPLALSYFGFTLANLQQPKLSQVIRKVLKIPLLLWPSSLARLLGRSIVRDFNEGIPWTPWIGVAITLFFSIGNEMFVDPATNGIPFINAYDHFMADVVGMALFLLVASLVLRSRLRLVAVLPT